MATPAELATRHNLYRETVFHAKSSVHAFVRMLRDRTVVPVRNWKTGISLIHEPVIGASESALWYADDNEKNWILTAGKIQNIRVAGRKLHSVEVPAGAVFSFWQQIGLPNRARGYVVGREIREGCLVPTVAGGLCQLSNALYDAALKAGFTIVERHRHSRVVPGSLAEHDRDATVKWNYVDLRFSSARPFRIEVEITHDKLLVRLRGERAEVTEANAGSAARAASKLNDCYSCGNIGCIRHQGDKVKPRAEGTTAFLLDDRWPEYDTFATDLAKSGDLFLLPLKRNRGVNTERYAWHVPTGCSVRDTPVPVLQRAIALRLNKGGNGSLPPLLMRFDKRMADAMVRRLPVACTHLVIAQNLLPFVWASGALGGRTFDVLMSRLPMERLHARLDQLKALHPESATAADHRASQFLVDLESEALTKARRIVTPHAEIAAVFNNKSMLLPWSVQASASSVRGTKVLFPASALGRKGAYEIREAARALHLQLVVRGRDLEEQGFWGELNVERAGADPFQDIGAVVLPAYVEHQPRILLRAIAKGIPVITTLASGLGDREGVTIVPIGDAAALAEGIKKQLR